MAAADPRLLRREGTEMSHGVFRLLAILGITLGPLPVAAQQTSLAAHAQTTASPFRAQIGRRLTFVCPGDVNVRQDIYGTDVYTDSSAICTAAAHAGVFTPGTSAAVTIVVGGPAKSFASTTRNGVTSVAYGPWDWTYTFDRGGVPGQVDWETTLAQLAADFAAPITVLCPPGRTSTAIIWGTDVYSESSAVCVAAVHAGAITADAGGAITITRVPKQASFPASVRNGVASRAWSDPTWRSYPQPYRVAAAAISAPAPTAAGAVATPVRAATSSKTSTSSSGSSAPAAAAGVPPAMPSDRLPTSGARIAERAGTTDPQVLSKGLAPYDLTVALTDGRVRLGWKYGGSADGFRTVKTFRVARAPGGSTSWTQLGSFDPWKSGGCDLPDLSLVCSFDDPSPPVRTTYSYQIIADHQDGTFAAATTTFTPTAPQDPSDLTATLTPLTKVRLSWKAVPGVARYLVSGPGVPASTIVAATEYVIDRAPPGNDVYRVASVYEPGGVLTAETAWPSARIGIALPASQPFLVMPAGTGSFRDTRYHYANAKPLACSGEGCPSLCGDLLPAFGASCSGPQPSIPKAVFADLVDLGFGRRVACRERGMPPNRSTLCWASSHGPAPGEPGFADPKAIANAAADSDQVRSSNAIWHDQDGTGFYTYASIGTGEYAELKLADTAVLDSQGPKAVPNACMACHGGKLDANGRVTGATLLPLDPSGFAFPDISARPAQEETIRQINAIVLGSSPAPAVAAYIRDMYGGAPEQPGAKARDDFVPAGWSAKPDVWKKVIRPYCAACHLAQTDLSFSSWQDFKDIWPRVQQAVCVRRTMPHAELPYVSFWAATDGGEPVATVLAKALGFASCP